MEGDVNDFRQQHSVKDQVSNEPVTIPSKKTKESSAVSVSNICSKALSMGIKNCPYLSRFPNSSRIHHTPKNLSIHTYLSKSIHMYLYDSICTYMYYISAAVGRKQFHLSHSAEKSSQVVPCQSAVKIAWSTK